MNYRNTPDRRRTFFNLILKTSVKNFRPTLSASLMGDISRNHNKKPKFIAHFLLFLKYDRTSKRTSIWAITSRFGFSRQEKIGLDTSANLHDLNYSTTYIVSFSFSRNHNKNGSLLFMFYPCARQLYAGLD